MARWKALPLVLMVLACERSPHRTIDAKPEASPGRREAGPGGRASLDTSSIAVLKEALASRDYATRLVAIDAIANARAELLTGGLEHALGDPEHDVRIAAVDALDRIHTTRALALLITVRDDTTEELDVRAAAAGALLRTTP